jgi:CBS domain-containing protein
MTTASEWMTSEVRACRPESDLGEAARLMWEHDCGALPVVDGGGKLVGMVTDRDVAMASLFQGRPLGAVAVSACMARQPHACAPSDSIERVIRVMADHQVRRVPVVGEDGSVRGILSVSDLLRRAMTLVDPDERTRLTTVLLEALASVGEPHRVMGAVPEAVPEREPELTPEPRREPERRRRRGRNLAGETDGAGVRVD